MYAHHKLDIVMKKYTKANELSVVYPKKGSPKEDKIDRNTESNTIGFIDY